MKVLILIDIPRHNSPCAVSRGILATYDNTLKSCIRRPIQYLRLDIRPIWAIINHGFPGKVFSGNIDSVG